MDAAQREEFDELLAHTSRSFSLGIQGLSGEVRDAVTLAYLLCRIFDTYEDTVHVPAPLRLACLERSQKLLQTLPSGSLEGLLEDWLTLHSMKTE
jgi:phytoene/squalene synthetase